MELVDEIITDCEDFIQNEMEEIRSEIDADKDGYVSVKEIRAVILKEIKEIRNYIKVVL